MQKTRYFELRNLAWELLIECGVDALPVDLYKIAKVKQWGIITEKQFGQEITKEVELHKVNNLFFIVYKETQDVQRLRFGIAHEFGHILLKHFISDVNELEKEANMFASRILMPAIILKMLEVKSPYGICKLCNVSLQSATHRFKRMEELEKRNKYLTSPLEKKLLSQFQEFINNH